MYNRNSVLFKRSLLTIAILSVSACSTTQRIDDYDLTKVGDGILKAGRSTAEAGGKIWDKTAYLLGFSDGKAAAAAGAVSDDSLLMDGQDAALQQGTATLQDGTVIRPVTIPTASDRQPLPIPGQSADDVAQLEPAIEPIDETLGAVEEVVGVEDLIHEVANSETLWIIAKRTTGDANNWHVLADVNNLAPNAAVFPGQQLIIPADMVKPGYFNASTPATTAAVMPRNLTQEAVEREQDAALTAANQSLRQATPQALNQQAVAQAAPQPQAMPQAVAPAAAPIVVATAKPAQPKTSTGGRAFDLQPGETLWDFAKRTTGDATNWELIAGHNQFSKEQALIVRPGQTIMVPDNLVRPELQSAQPQPAVVGNDASSAQNIAATIELPKTADSSALKDSNKLLSNASAQGETQTQSGDAQPIKIVEATFKSETPMEPIAVEQDAPVITDNDALSKIMVSGTYYPKAIYNDPDFSSSLLMRVSPGTTLQVSKAMGNWFQVETNKGFGYVHQRDIK